MKRVLIIDTKAGNLFSLKAAIERLGYQTSILDTPPDNQTFDAIVVPGQGRFGTVMKNIQANGWGSYLKQAWQQDKPILGICVGMQIFFESSEEDPDATGLAWLKGKVQKLDFPKKPMVGWAKLVGKLWDQSIVYFVNSYAVKHSEWMVSQTTYGETFCAAINKGSLIGVQFHPEKSSQVGSQIIKQALEGNQQQTIDGSGLGVSNE